MNFPSIYGIMVINGHYCLLMVMNDMIFNGYSWLLKVMNGYIYMDVNMVNILHMLHPIINHPADQPFGCCFTGPAMSIGDIDSHMLHVWNIYFHKRTIFGAIVGSLK